MTASAPRFPYESPDHQALAEAYIKSVLGKSKCSVCKSKDHVTASCPKLEICFLWNTRYQRPCKPSCKLRHVCAICESPDHNSCEHPNRSVCNNFNSANGCQNADKCGYGHVCKVCNSKSHSSFDCTMAYYDRGYSGFLKSADKTTCWRYNHKKGCNIQHGPNLVHCCHYCHLRHPAHDCLSLQAITCFNHNIVFKQESALCTQEECIYLHNCMLCGDPKHKAFQCSKIRNPKSFCSVFNGKKGCQKDFCSLQHVCKTCNGNHSAFECPAEYRPWHKLFKDGAYLHKIESLMRDFQYQYQNYNSVDQGHDPVEDYYDQNGHEGSVVPPHDPYQQTYQPEAYSSAEVFDPTAPPPKRGRVDYSDDPASRNSHPTEPLLENGTPATPTQSIVPPLSFAQVPVLPPMPGLGRNMTSLVTNLPTGEIVNQMEYSIIINGVEWSGILTRKS